MISGFEFHPQRVVNPNFFPAQDSVVQKLSGFDICGSCKIMVWIYFMLDCSETSVLMNPKTQLSLLHFTWLHCNKVLKLNTVQTRFTQEAHDHELWCIKRFEVDFISRHKFTPLV